MRTHTTSWDADGGQPDGKGGFSDDVASGDRAVRAGDDRSGRPAVRAVTAVADVTDHDPRSVPAPQAARADGSRPGKGPPLAPPKTTRACEPCHCPRSSGWRSPGIARSYEPGQHGLSFTNEDGKPIRPNPVLGGLAPGGPGRLPPDGTHFHDLRHYYASLLIRPASP